MSDLLGRRILIVEDDALSREGLAAILHAVGCETATATDGGSAMAMLVKFKPDLVLLDLMMTPINGWEFLDSKGLLSSVAAIPVVVLSGYAHIEQPLPPAQVVGVLLKPVEPAQVVRAVEKALMGVI